MYENMTLNELKEELIINSKKAYPLFISGFIYWGIMVILGQFFSDKQTALFYILGMGSIFPVAMLIGKMLKVSFATSKSPLATLAGIIGGIQIFFLPVWIVTYIEHYEYVPMMVGILAGSHFLPYVWIYKSKAYLFLTFGTAKAAFVFGYIFIENSFLFVPLSQAIMHLITAFWLIRESKVFVSKDSHSLINEY